MIPNVIQSSDNDRDLMIEICSVNLFKDVDFPLEKNNILHHTKCTYKKNYTRCHSIY